MKSCDRLTKHKQDARYGMTKKISEKIRECNYEIEIIVIEIHYTDKKEARIEEQKLIEEIGIQNLCNSMPAYRENSEYYRNHGNNESHIKKKASRKCAYNKAKQNEDWVKQEKERNKVRIRNKRATMTEEQKNGIKKKDAAHSRFKREFIRLSIIDI